MNYTPLHCHTDASPDGAGTVSSLVAEAKRLGLDALAMTDHGTLANAVAFWSSCTEAGIKPILGMEAYLSYKGERHHITLLSLNEAGFNQLVWLDSDSHKNNYVSGYPMITLDGLGVAASGGNIFALTGCASSALHKGREENGLIYVQDLVDAVGKRNVGIETMFIGSHDLWTRPIQLSRHTGLPVVVTNDTHFPCQRQFGAHQAITKARKGFTYDSKHLWLKSAEEIRMEGSKFVSTEIVIQGLLKTLEIGDRAETWDMKAPPRLPEIMDGDVALADALKKALKEDVALKGQLKTRIERLKYEFRILKEKNFLNYIYILWDIVRWARNNNIYVGPGRGSGGGSYVLYLLGITSVDPLEYGLLFERFLNPSRSDYPDVDVDFESDRRQEVVNYAHEMWGTIPIATYSSYSHKSAIHDIARVLAIPKTTELEAADSELGSDKFIKFINSHPDALETYNTMLGQIRHRGKHAAGVIIANKPVPIERTGDELVAAWAEGMNTKDLSKVGIVKYDLLGLTALSQLKLMGELTGCDSRAIAWDYEDESVYDLFCQGDVSGIFQWTGSDGIRDLTMRIAPRNFRDLATINALYRPGALDAGTALEYPMYMKEPRLLEPRIDRHLESTYGVICYQEQVMAVVAEVFGNDLASGGLASADNVRRLVTKADVGNPKWESDIEKLRSDFMRKGKRNDFDEDLLEVLWYEVYKHSRYSFNLSHATAYTTISYQMAWYKVNFRPEFTIAMLQYDRSNAQTYIMDAVEHELSIGLPSINYSRENYELFEECIYLPLTDIAFLGDEAVKFITEERDYNGIFKSYADFDKRIPKRKCNARARGMLERIGAFSDFKDDPGTALPKYDELPVTSTYQTQLEVLGYIVPTQGLLRSIQRLRNKPCRAGAERFAGFVNEIKEKTSAKGMYRVYHLSPHGSFWVRGGVDKIVVGSFVSGTKSDFGNSSDVKVYRLSTGDDE